MTPPRLRRFPPYLYRSGREPDPRFSLANERTMLAWIRTALALIAAGVALELLAGSDPDPFTTAAATILCGAGICIPILAWVDWIRVEGAMRHDRPLPSPTLTVFAGIAVAAAGALIILGLYL